MSLKSGSISFTKIGLTTPFPKFDREFADKLDRLSIGDLSTVDTSGWVSSKYPISSVAPSLNAYADGVLYLTLKINRPGAPASVRKSSVDRRLDEFMAANTAVQRGGKMYRMVKRDIELEVKAELAKEYPSRPKLIEVVAEPMVPTALVLDSSESNVELVATHLGHLLTDPDTEERTGWGFKAIEGANRLLAVRGSDWVRSLLAVPADNDIDMYRLSKNAGVRFLTWVWDHAGSDLGRVKIHKVLGVQAFRGGVSRIVCTGTDCDPTRVDNALADGYFPQAVTFEIQTEVSGESHYRLTLDDSLCVKAASLPTVHTKDEDEIRYERTALLNDLQNAIGSLFTQFAHSIQDDSRWT